MLKTMRWLLLSAGLPSVLVAQATGAAPAKPDSAEVT
jgi:hypothetical protein